MGEAKRKRSLPLTTVYHHTSSLRTNLIWMSGVIQLEGRGENALHPDLGEIGQSTALRRALRDFPPLAWFTTKIDVPNCLLKSNLVFVDKVSGEKRAEIGPGMEVANAIALQRLALGFPIADIPVVPWPLHPGAATPEGRELNESARELGDNPGDWYVSEVPVEVMKASEVWISRSIQRPKLERNVGYLAEIKRMVTLCREQRAYIPPSWLKPDQARRLVAALELPMAKIRE